MSLITVMYKGRFFDQVYIRKNTNITYMLLKAGYPEDVTYKIERI